MAENSGTPIKTGAGKQTPYSPGWDDRQIQSPLSKRTLDFDYFDVSRDAVAKKKRKEDGDISIKDLKKGNCTGTIQFRVTLLKYFEKPNSFSVRIHGTDGSAEIVMTAFQPKSRKIFDNVKMNGVYKMTDFEVVPASDVYDSMVQNSMRILINGLTRIEESSTNIETVIIKATPLSEMMCRTKGQIDDCLVVVAKNWGLVGGGSMSRRYLTVVDKTGCMRLRLWGYEAEKFGDDEKIVLGLRHVACDEYDGCTCLNSKYHTSILKNYDGAGAGELAKWFEVRDRQRDEELMKLNLDV